MVEKIIERFKSVLASYTKQSTRYVAVKEVKVEVVVSGKSYVLRYNPAHPKDFHLTEDGNRVSNELIAKVFTHVFDVVEQAEPDSMKG